MCKKLEIKSELRKSSEFNVNGTKDKKLIELLKAVNATYYLSEPSGMNYMQIERYAEANICVLIKQYNYRGYPQLWGKFDGAISIIDHLSNCGKDSINYIQSTPQFTESAVATQKL